MYRNYYITTMNSPEPDANSCWKLMNPFLDQTSNHGVPGIPIITATNSDGTRQFYKPFKPETQKPLFFLACG